MPKVRLQVEWCYLTDKPQYRVPLLSEIRELPWNGLTAVSTFSGCGGSSLGYKMAGMKVAWASEFVPAAQETYIQNHPDTLLDKRDIRQVTASDILDAIGLKPMLLDVFDGSPPCASFSTSGIGSRGWGVEKNYSGLVQRTDDLFDEYIRLVDGIRPKVFVAENVSGLIKGASKGYFVQIMTRLKALGYSVRCKILCAEWLGVPQARHRAIFIGVRNDLGFRPEYPKPLLYQYSIADALVGVEVREPLSLFDITRFAIGREYQRMPRCSKSKRFFNLIRPDIRKPCPTISATNSVIGAAGVCHPTEVRKFTIRELVRICGFPDDFILTGTVQQQAERLGRAVPPPMMKHVADTIVKQLLGAK